METGTMVFGDRTQHRDQCRRVFRRLKRPTVGWRDLDLPVHAAVVRRNTHLLAREGCRLSQLQGAQQIPRRFGLAQSGLRHPHRVAALDALQKFCPGQAVQPQVAFQMAVLPHRGNSSRPYLSRQHGDDIQKLLDAAHRQLLPHSLLFPKFAAARKISCPDVICCSAVEPCPIMIRTHWRCVAGLAGAQTESRLNDQHISYQG